MSIADNDIDAAIRDTKLNLPYGYEIVVDIERTQTRVSLWNGGFVHAAATENTSEDIKECLRIAIEDNERQQNGISK